MAKDFRTILTDAVGVDLVSVGDDIPTRNLADWSGLAPVRPLALARPRSAEDVSKILALCAEHRIAVVPQGGLTGLAGGAQPLPGAIALSMERMNRIVELDAAMATITAEAGVTLQAVQEAAQEAGFLFPLDLGARGSCTIGGTLATNAGGNRVIRYGMARDHVLGLEAVLSDGTIVSSMNKMMKNNAGYDLKQLFIGSEGTLGVVTRAVLRLQARPTFSATAFCACPDFASLVNLLKAARSRLGPSLTAFEAMWPSFYDFMTSRVETLRRPFAEKHGLYALVEISGFDEERDRAQLEELLEKALGSGSVTDAVLSRSEQDARDLWAVRDSVSEFVRLLGSVANFDVGLTIDTMGAVVEEVEEKALRRWPDGVALSFGHVGDSNLHVVVAVPSMGERQPEKEIAALVYDAVRAAGGTVSAEHGIGLIKRPYLAYSRSAEELQLMRRLKGALDPAGILNPGKVLA